MTDRRPLRVCHLAYSFYENDNRVVRYAEALSGRGDEVEVVALRRPDQPSRGAWGNVSVRRIQRRSRGEKTAWAYLLKFLWFTLKAFWVLSLAAARRPYDVVHVHNVPDFLVFAAVMQKLRGAKIVLDLHDLLPEFYAGKFGAGEHSAAFRLLLLVERLSCRFADHVIVANHLWHARVARRSAPAGRCTVVLNYPAPEFFRPVPGRGAGQGGPFVILYPGTLNHHQGLDVAVAAFAEACPAMPGAEFHIYGDGPSRESLGEQAHTLGVGDRVRIRDFVPFHDVPAVIASADVGVVPKRADGFGNEAYSTKILEFMAGGVPVIVSRTKIDTHYFDDQRVRFFTPGDARDLARQMRWAFDHPEELAALAEAGRAYASEYAWDKHAGDYLGTIDSLVRGSLADHAVQASPGRKPHAP